MLLALALSALGCGDDGADRPSDPVFPERDWEAEADLLLAGPDWYRHAVFYEVYVRSLQDSDGDGIGDLPGLTSRLDDLRALGVDALWLMPIMPTPFKDSGYDVADYEGINPDYGAMSDFEALLDAAHARGMRVIIDLVLNHTSSEHAWFQESRADKTNPKADWYVWSDTPSDPNNSCGTQNVVFGPSAWEYDAGRDQYYFHRFYPEQPDLNYENPEVVAATLDVARFWLDKGVDGFRCDVISLLYESADDCGFLDKTKAYIKQLRQVVDEYPDRVLVAEPTNLTDAKSYFGSGNDQFHMAFHFGFGYFWSLQFGSQNAAATLATFQNALTEYPAGSQDALVIGSHDVVRAFDAAQGDESRHRRAALIQMTMRGSPFIYYGEELGMRSGTAKVVDFRDSARTPMLWSGGPGYGFTTGTPWLPFGADADSTNLEVQQGDPASMHSYYRSLLGLRRGRAVWGSGDAEILSVDHAGVFAARRFDADQRYVVVVNMTDDPVSAKLALPGGESRPGRVLGQGTLTIEGEAGKLSMPARQGAVFRTK